MSKHDINKAYVSPYDKFFHQFDKDHEPSLAQLAEKNYYKELGLLRDHAKPKKPIDKIWEEF